MNIISIAGNLGRDAEVRYTQNGDAVCSFSVADSQGKDKEAIWWRCSLFGKRAESLAPYLRKGAQVTVAGNVTERAYEKDGEQKKAMEIRVSDVALQGGRSQEHAQQSPQRQQAEPRTAKAGQWKAGAQRQAPQPANNFDEDQDIPF